MRKVVLLVLVLLLAGSLLASAAPEFDRFVALVGVDDAVKGRNGEAIFRVKVDGKEVFKSDVLLPGEPPKEVDVPIAGATELGLYVDDEGDGHGGDWGNWLDARLVNSKTGEAMFLTDLVPEEKAWIPSHKDRNIVENKLSLAGRVYARGWGCISGDEMVFRNWSTVAAEREAEVDKQNEAAVKRFGAMRLRLADIPQGMTVLINGRPLQATDVMQGGALITADAVITVTINPLNREHTDWWKYGKCAVIVGDDVVPLSSLVQPTERVVHKSISPNRQVLVGEAQSEQQIYWMGQPLPPNGPITFDIRDLPLAMIRAMKSTTESDNQLIIRAQQFKTTEVDHPEAITSALLTVKVDDNPVAYVFSDNKESWSQSVAIEDWPKKLECVATPGADGSLADGFTIDLGIRVQGMSEPLWLSSVSPSFAKFDYREAKRLLIAGAWSLPGSGIARWDGLSNELEMRKKGEAALAAATSKINAAKNPAEIDAAIDEVLKLDPRQPEVRIAAAARFSELGELNREREQWGLIAEASRVDLALMQKIRRSIDEIWDKMDPEPNVYPDDSSSTRSLRALGALWSEEGDFANSIWTLELDPNNQWTDEITFSAPDSSRFAVLVNSRGVEVTAKITQDGRVIAEKTTRHPMLDVDAAKSGVSPDRPLNLVVSFEPDTTGIIQGHTMEVTAWHVKSEADLPTESWELAINCDGSAVVSRTSKAPVLAAIPRTATNLTIEGASGYTVQEPITEYLVDPDGRLSGSNFPMFVVPEPGKELKISYDWPDAAYNVSVSRMNWSGRKDHTYLATPATILDTEAKSTWRITQLPKDWKNTRYTPEPEPNDENLFRVEPKGGLSAEWEARDVPTSWIVMSHANLNFYAPDNPTSRRWLPVWMNYVKMIYDREVLVSGYENPFYLYIAPTGPGQLSGYGGGTVADRNACETWIACTGRMAPCLWRHFSNVTGVDAHELHWIQGNCMVLSAPVWATEGFGAWLEQTGWEVSRLADANKWRRTRLDSLQSTLEMVRQTGSNPIQAERPEWDALPGNIRERAIHLGWHIVDELASKYGDDFWAKFWAEQRRLNSDVYGVLSPRAKQILLVDELVRISKDPTLRERFVNEWLFDLTPDPQDAPDRFLILPRQPRVTAEDKPEFAALACDDQLWSVASGTGKWSEVVPTMEGHRGTAWYRFSFKVPANFKTQNLELVLAGVSGDDTTYLNGKELGSTTETQNRERSRRSERVYKIASGTLKPGKRNVVAVRVTSKTGGGIGERPTIVSRIVK